jgi:hypothetical protein
MADNVFMYYRSGPVFPKYPCSYVYIFDIVNDYVARYGQLRNTGKTIINVLISRPAHTSPLWALVDGQLHQLNCTGVEKDPYTEERTAEGYLIVHNTPQLHATTREFLERPDPEQILNDVLAQLQRKPPLTDELVMVPRKPTPQMLHEGEGITDLVQPDDAFPNTKESRMREIQSAWEQMIECWERTR